MASLLLAGAMTTSLFILPAAAKNVVQQETWRLDSREWGYEFAISTVSGKYVTGHGTDDDVYLYVYRYTSSDTNSTNSEANYRYETLCDNDGNDFENGSTGYYSRQFSIAPWMISNIELHKKGYDDWHFNSMVISRKEPVSMGSARWPRTETISSIPPWDSKGVWASTWLYNNATHSVYSGFGDVFKRNIQAVNFTAENLGLTAPVYLGADGSVTDGFTAKRWEPKIYDARYSPKNNSQLPNLNPYYFPTDDPPTLSAEYKIGTGNTQKLDITKSDSFVYVAQEAAYQSDVLAHIKDGGTRGSWNDSKWSYRTVQLNKSQSIYDQLTNAHTAGTLTMNWDFPARSASGKIKNSVTVPIYRRVYQFGSPTVSAEPALYHLSKDNDYVHQGSAGQKVTVTVPVASVHDQGASRDNSGLAGALKNHVHAALYDGKTGQRKIADGTVGQKGTDLICTFTVPDGVDTGTNGLRLRLTGTKVNYENRGDYICETTAGNTEVSDGGNQMDFYFSSIKADTKAPTVTLCNVDGNEIANALETAAKTHTFYPTADETLYTFVKVESDTKADSVLREGMITWQLNDGSKAATAPVSTSVLTETPVELALKQHEEGTYDLTITAQDKAGNPLTKTTWPVELDNKAPMVEREAAVVKTETDGAKRFEQTFRVSDRNGQWRLNYCFVPTGAEMPQPGSSATQVPGDPAKEAQWYFIDQNTGGSPAMIKVARDADYTGTLYYYAVDQFGNDSREENESEGREAYNSVPVVVYNKLGEGTLNSDAGDYAKDKYDISLTAETGSTAYYAWAVQGAAAPADDAFQPATHPLPLPVVDPRTGTYTLYYKFKGNDSQAFSDTRSQDFAFDNTDTTLTAVLNKPLIGRSVSARINITDPSGIRSASYRIVDPDGKEIDGLEEQTLNVKATREVDTTVTLAPPDNGIYNLRVTAEDYNGNTKSISYDGGTPGQDALLFAIRKQAPAVGLAETNIKETTAGGLPLVGKDTSYTVTVPVEEAMRHMAAGGPMAGLGERLRCQFSTDGVNWPSDKWEDLGPMRADADKYTLTAEIKDPTTLKEGENRLFFRFSCGLTEAGADAATVVEAVDEELVSEVVEVQIFKDSAGPQVTGPVYDSTYPTNREVVATVTLWDEGTDGADLTLVSSDTKVAVEPVAGVNGQFRITVRDNVDLKLAARDKLGNTTQVPVKVDWIDGHAPAPIGVSADTKAQGARTDGTIALSLTDRNGVSAELALIDMGDVTGDTVPEPVRTEPETGGEGTPAKEPDDFERFSALRSGGQIVVTTNAVPDGVSYQITLRGMTGRYALGLYAKDNLGNETLTGVQGSVLTVADAEPAIADTTFSPKVTKSDTIATVTFNVPLAVLPQDEIRTELPDGETDGAYATVDEYNLGLLFAKNSRVFSGALTTTWRCGEIGDYKLYTLDETGRAQVLTFTITEKDVSFIEGFPITVRYLQDGLDVTDAVKAKQWLGLNDAANLQIEITPADDYQDAQQFFTIPANAEQSGTALNEGASVRVMENALPEELKPAVELPSDPAPVQIPDAAPASEPGPEPDQAPVQPADPVPAADPDADPQPAPLDKPSDYYSKLVFDVGKNGRNTKQAVFSSYTLDGLPEDRLQAETVSLGNVDETAPAMGAVTYSTTALTNGNVIATVSFSDPESGGVKLEQVGTCAAAEVKIAGDKAEITFSENAAVTIRAANAAGLSAEYPVSVENIDKRPITEDTDFRIDWFYEDHLGAWQPVTGPDMACRQVKAVFVPLSDGGKTLTATEGTDTLYLSDLDKRSGTFHYKDGAGNQVDFAVAWTNFDHDPPTIAVDFSETPTNQNIALTVRAEDGENGGVIAHCEVTTAGGAPLTVTGAENGVYQASIPANGSYYIQVWDLAGNSRDQTITVNSIDKTAVDISSVIYTPNRGEIGAPAYTAGSVEAYIQAFNKKGVTVTKVEPGEGLTENDISVTANGRRIRFKENGNVDVTFVDSYGNVGVSTLAVYNILKAAPTLEYEVALDETKTSAVISFRQMTEKGVPIDLVRDLKDLYISAPGLLGQYTEQVTAADTLVATENGTYTVGVFDEVGNYQSLNVVVKDIDKAPPVIENVAWSYGYSLNTDGTWTEQVAAGSHDVAVTETGLLLTGEDLAVAEGNVIRVNETNQDVTITLTANKPVSLVGTNGALSKEAVMVYTENGAFRFNLAGVNDVSASYGVNVQLIDKARPVITFGGASELTFVEGDKSGDRYDKSLLLDYAAADVKNGVSSDLTSQVTVDYGSFDPDHFENNTFDRNRPYTITYTVFDSVGNKTVATRTVRLVSRNDVVLLVDGRMPNSSGDISLTGSTIRATLKNSAGTAYVKYLPGRYTMGEMKYKGTLVEAKNGEYVIENLSAGWYTLAVQTDNKDFLTVYVFVDPTEEGADQK